MQYNTIQYNTIQYNAMQYNAMQCNTIQYTVLNNVWHLPEESLLLSNNAFLVFVFEYGLRKEQRLVNCSLNYKTYDVGLHYTGFFVCNACTFQVATKGTYVYLYRKPFIRHVVMVRSMSLRETVG